MTRDQKPARSRLAILFGHDGVVAMSALLALGLGLLTGWGTWVAWALVPVGVALNISMNTTFTVMFFT